MITFSSVTKQFGVGGPALQDVSFEIEPGELITVTGPSGSGKTTLMRLLTREYIPSAGEIIFDGTPLHTIRSSQVHHHRRKIGVVFQDYRLLDELNVWENIALALSIINTPQAEIESRVTDLLKLVGLVEKAFLFPNQLSGGEAQRVSIARALSTGPRVIFADEPTGNLDPGTSKSIIELLRKINELGTTVIVTTHDPLVLDILKKARLLHLEDGKLVKDTGGKKKTADHGKHDAEPSKHDSASTKHESEPDKHADTAKQNHEKHQEHDEHLEHPASKTRFSLKLPKISLPFGSREKDDVKSSADERQLADQEMTDEDESDNKKHVSVQVEKL